MKTSWKPRLLLQFADCSTSSQTAIYVTNYAAALSSSDFKDPETFAPERWLDDPRYLNDDRSASQPFSRAHQMALAGIKRALSNALFRVHRPFLTIFPRI